MSKTLWGSHIGLEQGRSQALLPSRSVKIGKQIDSPSVGMPYLTYTSTPLRLKPISLGETIRVSSGALDNKRRCSQGPVLQETWYSLSPGLSLYKEGQCYILEGSSCSANLREKSQRIQKPVRTGLGFDIVCYALSPVTLELISRQKHTCPWKEQTPPTHPFPCP